MDSCVITTVKNKKITIKQIAEELGYSPTVVSHSLSHKGTVGEKTRCEIIEYAKKIGYKPSLQAQTVRKKNIRIAVHIPRSPEFLNQKFTAGIKTSIRNFTGNNLECDFLNCTKHSYEQFLTVLKTVIDGNYDGAILAVGDDLLSRDPEYAQMINQKNIPIVLIGAKSKLLNSLATIHPEPQKSGAIAADLLNMANCKDVLLMYGNSADIHNATVEGFTAQAKLYNMNFEITESCADNETVAYNIAKEYLAKNGNRGVFLTNCFGWAVEKAMEELNIHSPLVCMDMHPNTAKLIRENKQLAAICQHQTLQGQYAADHLLKIILSGQSSTYEDIFVSPEIVTRALL